MHEVDPRFVADAFWSSRRNPKKGWGNIYFVCQFSQDLRLAQWLSRRVATITTRALLPTAESGNTLSSPHLASVNRAHLELMHVVVSRSTAVVCWFTVPMIEAITVRGSRYVLALAQGGSVHAGRPDLLRCDRITEPLSREPFNVNASRQKRRKSSWYQAT